MSSGDIKKENDDVTISWTYRGKESEWDSFDRRMMRHMRRKFDAFGEKIWLGQIPKIQELEESQFSEYCLEVWNAIEIDNPRVAQALWNQSSGFWQTSWQENWMSRQLNLMCDFIEEHSEGQAEMCLVNYTGDKSQIRKFLYKQFGSGSGGDIHQKELEYEKGLPEKGQEAFPSGVNMPEKLRQLESRRLYFWKMCMPEKRENYVYCQESKLVRIVLDHINNDYKDCVSRILDLVKIRKMIKEEREKNEETVLDELDTHERSFNDDWLPSWKVLQSGLILEYKNLCKKSENKISKLPVAVGSVTGIREIRCYACGENGHKKGASECKAGKFDIHPCAPPEFKSRQESKKRKFTEEKNNPRFPRKNKQNKGSQDRHCHAYNFGKGTCRYGAKCKFSHDKVGNGNNKNDVFSPSQQRIVNAMVASAVKKTAKHIAKKSKKERESSSNKASDDDNDYAAIMASILLAPMTRTIRRELCLGSNIVLKTNLHDVENNIGIDSDAAISISTLKEDFLWIDGSSQLMSKISPPSGINGGSSKVGGIGPMIVMTKSGKLVIDPEAMFIEPGDTQPNFRVMSTQRLKSNGVRLVGCYNNTDIDVLQDRKTKEIIHLSEEGPSGNKILVLETRPLPVVNTGELKLLVKEILKGNKSALVSTSDTDLTSTSATLTHESNSDLSARIKDASNYNCMVFNIAKLNDEERTRLYVRKFGYCDSHLLCRMAKDDDFGTLPKFVALNEDNPVKDAGKFVKKSHFRTNPEISMGRPPWFRTYVDGYGGGKSLGVPSFEKAIGGYLFVCSSTGDLHHKLYASHEQFPIAVFQFLLHVEGEGNKCHELYVDTFSVNISVELEEVVALFHCKIVPVSAGTPQEVSFVETQHRIIAGRSRSMLLGAPHLPAWAWALSDKYAVYVGRYLPQSTRNWKCAAYLNLGKVPDWRYLCIHVFGAPCRYAPMEGPVHKRASLTEEGFFVGVQHPMVIVVRKRDMEVISVSKKKVIIYESYYTCPLSVPPSQMNPSTDGPNVKAIANQSEVNESGKESLNSKSSSTTRSDESSASKKSVTPKHNRTDSSDETSASTNSAKSDLERTSYDESLQSKRSVATAQNNNDCSISELGTVAPDSIEMVSKNVDMEPLAKDSITANETVEHIPRHRKSVKSLNAHTVSIPNTNAAESFRPPTRLDASALKQVASQVEGSYKPEHLTYDEGDLQGKIKLLKDQVNNSIEDRGIRELVLKSLNKAEDYASGAVEKGYLAVGKKSGGVNSNNIISKRRERNKSKKTKPMPQDGKLPEANGKKRNHKKASRKFKLKVGDYVSAEPSIFDGDEPGSFSNGNSDRQYGFVVKSWPSKNIVKVRWLDGEVFFHAVNELKFEKTKVNAQMVVTLVLNTVMGVEEDPLDKDKWPKDFFQALIRPDWRDWVQAVKKEINSWMDFNAYTEIPFGERTPGSSIVPLGELYTRKRDLSYKFRQYLMGNLLKKGKDFDETFSSCISWDGIRWCAAVACVAGKLIFGLDAVTGFLQAKEQFDLYAFIPSHGKYSELSYEKLAQIRLNLLKLIEKEGEEGLAKFAKAHKRESRTNPKTCYRLNSSIYGAPSANHEWEMLFQHAHVNKCGMTLSEVEPSLYVKIAVDSDNKVQDWIIANIWTDDVRYFGTERMLKEYEQEIQKHVKVKFLGVPGEFVGTEFVQDLDLGLCELKAPKYWESALIKFEKYFPNGIKERFNPLTVYDEKVMEGEVTDNEFEEAKHFEYRELCGVISYQAGCTKLEMRYAVSICSRFRAKWGRRQFNVLKKVFEYGFTTRHTGLIYSKGLDPHGDNTMYCHADSGHSLPRSYGCTDVMMNGAAISLSAKRHTITASSTCHDELIEFAIATNRVVGFRNIMVEMGLSQKGATIIYQDNEAAIQISMNRGALSKQSRHMSRKILTARNKIEDCETLPKYIETKQMVADIGTKALADRQFAYLRDQLTGYALVKDHHPSYTLPAYVTGGE